MYGSRALRYDFNPAPECKAVVFISEYPDILVGGELFDNFQRFLFVRAQRFKLVEVVLVINKVFYKGLLRVKIVLKGLPGLKKIISRGVGFLDNNCREQ